MRKVLAFMSFAVAISSLHIARADLVPDNEKSVKLAIRVDGDVPSGQTIVLGHTFRGMDVVKLGTAARIEWHPMAGRMQLAAVPSSALMADVEQLRQDLKRTELDAVFNQGKPCHNGFDGIRTIPTSAPADVIQWNYRVSFMGGNCTATLVSMQFFDKSGAEVAATDIPNLPANIVVGPSEKARPVTSSAAAEPAKDPPAPATPSEASQIPKGACGCRIGPGAAELEMATIVEKWGPFASFASVVLALAWRRKPRRRQ